jgi:hypothetical protein
MRWGVYRVGEYIGKPLVQCRKDHWETIGVLPKSGKEMPIIDDFPGDFPDNFIPATFAKTQRQRLRK